MEGIDREHVVVSFKDEEKESIYLNKKNDCVILKPHHFDTMRIAVIPTSGMNMLLLPPLCSSYDSKFDVPLCTPGNYKIGKEVMVERDTYIFDKDEEGMDDISHCQEII